VPEAPEILHVGPDPIRPGGMGTVVAALMESSLGRSYRMAALPTYVPGDLPRTVLGFPLVLRRLGAFCRGPGRRIVHIHGAARGSMYRKAVCVLLARALGRPTILHMHSGGVIIDEFAGRIGPARRRLITAGIAAADRVVSVSRAGAEAIARHFGRADVLVVSNPAPVGEDLPRPGAGGRSVLYLGGFTEPLKGGGLLLEALPLLREQAPGAEIVLAGPGEPGAEQRRALEQAGARWAGWLDPAAKRTELAAAAVVVFPAISEGLPMALLEAMANGRAIVATRVGGMPEVLDDGTEARFVPGGDPAALAGAIAALLADPDARDALGTAARRRVQEFDVEMIAGRLDALYRALLGERDGR
jgi:glycosyltransferase involved in cell wall biosynthesis